jgi:hypothetical protein
VVHYSVNLLIFFWLVGWLDALKSGWLAGILVGWSVARSVGYTFSSMLPFVGKVQGSSLWSAFSLSACADACTHLCKETRRGTELVCADTKPVKIQQNFIIFDDWQSESSGRF